MIGSDLQRGNKRLNKAIMSRADFKFECRLQTYGVYHVSIYHTSK